MKTKNYEVDFENMTSWKKYGINSTIRRHDPGINFLLKPFNIIEFIIELEVGLKMSKELKQILINLYKRGTFQHQWVIARNFLFPNDELVSSFLDYSDAIHRLKHNISLYNDITKWEENDVTDILKEYIKVPTVEEMIEQLKQHNLEDKRKVSNGK